MDDVHGAVPRCLNCMHITDEALRYCPACGQSTRDLRVSVRHLLGDFFENLFSLDSKLVQSLLPLLLRPGLLTRAFIDGKRVRFLPPVRMYLVFSVLFFLTLSLNKPDFDDAVVQIDKGDGEVITLRNKLANEEALGDPVQREAILAELDTYLEEQAPEPEEEPDEPEQDMGTVDRLIDRHIVQKAERIEDMEGREVLNRLFPIMINYLSWSMFLLMPVFAFFLKLLYIRRDPVYLDHLIFAFHYHSFVFLFLSLTIFWKMLMPIDIDATFDTVVFFTITLYLYKAMRRVYGQGRIKTLMKLSFLSCAYFIALMIASTLAAIATFVMADF